MIERAELKQIRKDLEEALKPLAEKHGILFSTGNIYYSPVDFTIKVTGQEKSSSGGGKKDDQDWKLGVTLGLVEEEWLGQTYISRGKTLKVIGINHKKRKNKIVLESQPDKQIYIASAQSVKISLSK